MRSTWVWFISLAAMLLAGLTPPADAQQPAKLRRIGYLDQGSFARDKHYLDAFRQGLRDLGWVEGKNIVIETRFAEGKSARLPALAAELVARKADVLVTWTTPAALAAKHATATIPIVIGFTADPVGSRIVDNLAHPGGNITGWTHSGLELRAKYLQLLKEAVPEAVRFGVLWNPMNQVHKPSLQVIEGAAKRFGVELILVSASDPKELQSAFSTLVGKRAQALVVFPDGMFLAQTPLILSLAAQSRLPTMYGVREIAEAGGLMAYGANISDMHRRLGASLVDKILKGAKPADLPVEQPTSFELVINLETARALGVTISPSLRLRANRLIE